MNAEIGTRFNPNDRTPLQEVIPLRTPLVLFVDPSSVCNFRCKFCPCGLENKENWNKDKTTNVMSYELFRKIIDDITEFPDKLKTLRLYKEGEPLINRYLPEMIYYAKKKDVAEKIDFTTNGSLLTPDLNFALLDAGLDRINISVEALTEEEYFNVSQVKIDMKNFRKNIEHLYKNRGNCKVFIKINDYGLGEHTVQEFYDMFGDMCDNIAVENITPVWPEFNLDKVEKKDFNVGIYNNEIKPVQVCPYIFYSMCVNSNGEVSACLMDWNHKLIVGDAKKESLKEIWESKKMREMQVNHLSFKKEIYEPCSECGQLKFAAMDNIDSYANDLLKSF